MLRTGSLGLQEFRYRIVKIEGFWGRIRSVGTGSLTSRDSGAKGETPNYGVILNVEHQEHLLGCRNIAFQLPPIFGPP